MSKQANTGFPEYEKAPEWQEARGRVETYLCALNVTSQARQQEIIAAVLERAGVRLAQNPGENPTAIALGEFRNLAEEWFQKFAPAAEHAPAGVFVSYFAIDAMKKWPDAFLAEDVPAGLRQELQKCEVRAAPDLMISRMVPQPFDSPLADLNLPTALTQLTKDLPPSFVAKVIAFIFGIFGLWSGNRLR